MNVLSSIACMGWLCRKKSGINIEDIQDTLAFRYVATKDQAMASYDIPSEYDVLGFHFRHSTKMLEELLEIKEWLESYQSTWIFSGNGDCCRKIGSLQSYLCMMSQAVGSTGFTSACRSYARAYGMAIATFSDHTLRAIKQGEDSSVIYSNINAQVTQLYGLMPKELLTILGYPADRRIAYDNSRLDKAGYTLAIQGFLRSVCDQAHVYNSMFSDSSYEETGTSHTMLLEAIKKANEEVDGQQPMLSALSKSVKSTMADKLRIRWKQIIPDIHVLLKIFGEAYKNRKTANADFDVAYVLMAYRRVDEFMRMFRLLELVPPVSSISQISLIGEHVRQVEQVIGEITTYVNSIKAIKTVKPSEYLEQAGVCGVLPLIENLDGFEKRYRAGIEICAPSNETAADFEVFVTLLPRCKAKVQAIYVVQIFNNLLEDAEKLHKAEYQEVLNSLVMSHKKGDPTKGVLAKFDCLVTNDGAECLFACLEDLWTQREEAKELLFEFAETLRSSLLLPVSPLLSADVKYLADYILPRFHVLFSILSLHPPSFTIRS